MVAVLDALLSRTSSGPGGQRPVPGLPQGSSLSPLWANLALSRDEALEAIRVINEAVEDLGMRLGTEKTAAMSFDEGFCFLGEDFGPRYPPALDDHRVVDPPRRALYVGVQGARVRVSGGRCLVESPQDEELLDVPTGGVERLVCFGSVGVSAGFRSWALAHDVEMVFCSRRGSYLGHALDLGSRVRVDRVRAQLAVADDARTAMVFARAVVEAKVRKQIVVVQKAIRRQTVEVAGEAVGQMRHLLRMVPLAESRDELMGLEGAAAREYFAALGELVPEEVRFTGRSRRPPQDMVNSALSFGYTILLGETISALCAAGLDPAIGVLHAEDESRPSPALDLMEEFRPLVVDQVVLAATRRGELRAVHGRRQDGVDGVLLTKAGREALIGGYERRMLQRTRGALPEFSGSLRRHLYRQAQRVAAFVRDPAVGWTGLSWR
ncbi:MAG: CRISP-associated protein Cas1 [Actinomycetota bacterium]|nr:CRISP-associated protein Cas1 [Actinomycetota bacterium]